MKINKLVGTKKGWFGYFSKSIKGFDARIFEFRVGIELKFSKEKLKCEKVSFYKVIGGFPREATWHRLIGRVVN